MKTLTINKDLLKTYKQFRTHSPFMLVGRNAELALNSAKTLLKFRELEAAGKVRMCADVEEENYFDVYGEPETTKQKEAICESIESNGIYYVYSQVDNACDCCGRDDWETADGVGMCVYSNPVDPFENGYVIDMMRAAIEKVK